MADELLHSIPIEHHRRMNSHMNDWKKKISWKRFHEKIVAAVTIMEWLKVLLIIGSRENKTKKSTTETEEDKI